MKVGIDATAVLDEGTGLENHVLTLVDALANHTDVEIVTYVRRKGPVEWRALADRIEVHALKTDSQAWATQALLPKTARRHGLDVLYCGAKPAPAAYGGPLLVGIHDPIPWTRPDVMGPRSAPWFRAFHRVSVIRGATICTPTVASKNAISRVLGVAPDSIHVIGNGLVPWYPDRSAAGSRPSVAPDQPYILAVGRADPRRDLTTVLDAWDDLHRRHPQVRLVLAGKVGWKVESVISRARQTPGVVMLGPVEATQLAGLYAHCEAFVTASIHEGFGLTVLEALAHGAPVVASAIPPHVEVGGDAVGYFPPADWRRLSTLLGSVLENREMQDRLRKSGPGRAQNFSGGRLASRWLTAACLAGNQAPRSGLIERSDHDLVKRKS